MSFGVPEQLSMYSSLLQSLQERKGFYFLGRYYYFNLNSIKKVERSLSPLLFCHPPSIYSGTSGKSAKAFPWCCLEHPVG